MRPARFLLGTALAAVLAIAPLTPASADWHHHYRGGHGGPGLIGGLFLGAFALATLPLAIVAGAAGPPSAYRGPPPGYYGPPPGYGPPGYYGPPRPPPSGYYGPPQAYAPPPGYGPPQGYGPPPGYGPPQGYGRPQGYPPQQGYGPPQGYPPPQGSQDDGPPPGY
jgi:hypothetical protein